MAQTINPSTAILLSRLHKVKRTRTGWVACCPAHSDRSPSLSIRETEDGRVLIHCFAGCPVHEVVAAVGMELHQLFPPRPLWSGRKPEARPFSAEDALRCLSFEATIVYIAAVDLLAGKTPTKQDMARLAMAVSRISKATGVAL